jgi:hypothetical protein
VLSGIGVDRRKTVGDGCEFEAWKSGEGIRASRSEEAVVVVVSVDESDVEVFVVEN